MRDLAIKILIAMAGMTGGFLLRHFAARPKLRLEGQGCGSHAVDGIHLSITQVYVYNDPSFFGLKVARESAQIKSAVILDQQLKTFVGPSLVWQKGDPQDGLQELEPEHTIGSGSMGLLCLYAKGPSDETFFIYRATTLNTPPETSWPKYKELHKFFTLKLFDANRREYRYKLDVRNGEQGVSLFFKKTLRDRWQALLEAFK